MGRDSIPEDSASIANWVFKKLWVKTRDVLSAPLSLYCMVQCVDSSNIMLSNFFGYLFIHLNMFVLDCMFSKGIELLDWGRKVKSLK